MKSTRIVYFGSSSYSMPLLEWITANCTLGAVVSRADASAGRGFSERRVTPVAQFAKDRGLPLFQPQRIKDPTFWEHLSALKGDLFVVASYGHILPQALLDIPRLGCVNLHASLLPKYRGASPIQYALMNGDAITGNSLQWMSLAMDEGDLIAQSHLSIAPRDDYDRLTQALAQDGAHLFAEQLPLILQGVAARIPQNHAEATYTQRIPASFAEVDWKLYNATEIWNRFRAFARWPGLRSVYVHQGKSLPVKLTQIALVPWETGFHAFAPGTVVRANTQGIWVRCSGNSVLSILRLQISGKREVSAESFINGYQTQVGQAFHNAQQEEIPYVSA